MGCVFSKKIAMKEWGMKREDHVPIPSNIEKQKLNPPLLDMNMKSSENGGSSHCFPRAFTFQELAVATNNFGVDCLIGKGGRSSHGVPRAFTFQELARATKNFGEDCLIGEGGFGKVYKGWLGSSNQIVAIKRFGQQGNRVFLTDMLMSSLLDHPNLLDLIGYCAKGDKRFLVYEYMPLGSLRDLLHDLRPDQTPLDWKTRMKIAAGIARGLEYMHEKANPPIIHRNVKCSNILLDREYRPALYDFGLAKLGPPDGKTFVSTGVVGTAGYVAPEYAMEGLVSLGADVYSFGVVLLEIITGQEAIDVSRAPGEKHIVTWASPLLKNRRNFPSLVDPALQGRYPDRGLCSALSIAAMCTHEKVCVRPHIGDIVTALNYLASQEYEPEKEKIGATTALNYVASHEYEPEKQKIEYLVMEGR